MKRQNNANRTPSKWQNDPEMIVTDKVQYWSGGCMMTAQMSRDDARQAVTNGYAFVMTCQAIGRMTDDGQMDS